jgi:flagellar hook assembly protein FlgD
MLTIRCLVLGLVVVSVFITAHAQVSAQENIQGNVQGLDEKMLSLFENASAASSTSSAQFRSAAQRADRALSHYTMLKLKPAAFENVHSFKNKSLQLALPLESRTLHLLLEPYNAFAPNATLIAKTASGDVPIQLDEHFALYRGSVEGEPSSMVNVSVSNDALQMVIHLGTEVLTVERVPAEPQDKNASIAQANDEQLYVIYTRSDNKEQRTFSCQTDENSPASLGDNDHGHQPLSTKKNTQQQSAERLEAEMAVEIDLATYQALGSNQTQATQYAAGVIAAVSQMYERDLNTRLVVSSVQVWTTADPYTSITSTGSALDRMTQTWNSTFRSVRRDLAHLLTVRSLGGGMAWVDALCGNAGYGVSSGVRAAFPIDPAWTTMVVAHEIGHNFGSRHTHSCWWQGGAIDRCAPAENVAPGQAPCFTSVVASRGTIMSYCHTQPGGMANIDMRFHPLCSAYMRTRAEAASCLSTSGGGGTVVTQGPASITTFAPATGSEGTAVVITGANFANVLAVRFGGVDAASFTVNSSTQITAILGKNGASGGVEVVTPVNTAVASQTFAFVYRAVVYSFEPARAASGTSVSINGANFTNITDVRFGGRSARSFAVKSPTQIVAVVSDSAMSGVVQVVAAAATASSTQSFTFIPTASITSFAPATAPAGASVLITGANFTDVSAVRFGGVNAASFTVNSPTSIAAVLSTGATGSIEVVTTTNTATSAKVFTFIPPASISSFIPSTGPTGTLVTIEGVNFINVSAVRFGGVNAASFTVHSPTKITAVVGAGASGAIQVITAGNIASSVKRFGFVQAVTASENYVAFPPTRPDSTSLVSLEFRNNTTTPLTFFSAVFADVTSNDFDIVSNTVEPDSTLAPGSVQTIVVRYRPSTTASRSTAWLELSFSGDGGKVSVGLIGEVNTTPLLLPSASSIAIPMTRVGEVSEPLPYEIQGWYVKSPVSITASATIQFATSSTGTWQEWLELSADSVTSRLRTTIWIRYAPTMEESTTATIVHRSGVFSVPIGVFCFTEHPPMSSTTATSTTTASTTSSATTSATISSSTSSVAPLPYPAFEQKEIANEDMTALHNYPNPFTSETIIEWVQAESVVVSVTIHTAQGAIVRSFTLPAIAAARQHIIWDGRDENGQALANGVYFVHLHNGNDKASGKRLIMTLAR